MADSAKPKRRMVRRTETVREKADKAQLPTPPKKVGILGLTGHYIAAPFKWLGRPLAKVGRKLGRIKPLRILGLILWPRYFRNSWKELRQVTWPTRRETWQLTLAVIIFSIVFGVLIAIADFGLDKLFKQVLLK